MTDSEIANFIQARIQGSINTVGHAVMGVMASEDSPTFSYTVGLFPKYGFEIFMSMVPAQYATLILNDIAEDLAEGFVIEPGTVYKRWFANDLPVKFAMANPEKVKSVTVQAHAFYNQYVPIMQLLVADKDGNLPGDENYAKDQPVMNHQHVLY